MLALCQFLFERGVGSVEDNDDLPRLHRLTRDAVERAVEEFAATMRGNYDPDVGRRDVHDPAGADSGSAAPSLGFTPP